MNDIERAIEDLDTLVEIARNQMTIGAWLGITESALVIREALEKQIPMKPIKAEYDYNCPICGYEYLINQNYCQYCGQKLDWSEVENE